MATACDDDCVGGFSFCQPLNDLEIDAKLIITLSIYALNVFFGFPDVCFSFKRQSVSNSETPRSQIILRMEEETLQQ